MLGIVRDFVRGLLPFGLYVTILWACVSALRGRMVFPIGAIIVCAVLPNLWYQVHPFPFGKDTTDFLIGCCLLGLLLHKHIVTRSQQSVLLWAYLFYVYLQVWNTTLRYGLPLPFSTSNAVLVDFKNYAEMIILYFIAFHSARDEKTQRQLLTICMVAYFLIVLREARSFEQTSSDFSYDSRAAGPFWIVGLGANQFAAFVIHFGAIALALSFYLENKKERWFLLATSIIAVKPLFFAYSRGAYLAALVVLLFFGILKKRSLLVLLLVVGIAWQTLLPPSVVSRINTTQNTDGQLESSAAERLVLWDKALQLYSDSPVIGSGLNSFGVSHIAGTWTSVHNLYLQTLAEQGIVGLAFLVAVILSAVATGVRLFVKGKTPLEKGLGLGFFGCVLAIIVTNIFGDRWTYYSTGALFWIFWGIADRMLKNHALERTARAAIPGASSPRSVELASSVQLRNAESRQRA